MDNNVISITLYEQKQNTKNIKKIIKAYQQSFVPRIRCNLSMLIMYDVIDLFPRDASVTSNLLAIPHQLRLKRQYIHFFLLFQFLFSSILTAILKIIWIFKYIIAFYSFDHKYINYDNVKYSKSLYQRS